MRVAILLAASCYRNRVKLRPCRPLRLLCDFTFTIMNYVCFFFLFADINHCYSSPCLNNGTCQNSLDDYQCFCHAKFSGSNCEQGKLSLDSGNFSSLPLFRQGSFQPIGIAILFLPDPLWFIIYFNLFVSRTG